MYNAALGPFPVTGRDFVNGRIRSNWIRYVQIVPKKEVKDENLASSGAGTVWINGVQQPLVKYFMADIPGGDYKVPVKVASATNEAFLRRTYINFKVLGVKNLQCTLDRMDIVQKDLAGAVEEQELVDYIQDLYGGEGVERFNRYALI